MEQARDGSLNKMQPSVFWTPEVLVPQTCRKLQETVITGASKQITPVGMALVQINDQLRLRGPTRRPSSTVARARETVARDRWSASRHRYFGRLLQLAVLLI